MSAHEHLSDQFGDYRMDHRPAGPDNDSGAQFHNADEVMPDVTGPQGPRLYDFHAAEPGRKIPFHQSISHESFQQMRAAKGNPDAEIKIYRSVPKAEHGINPGDWVSTSRRYAERHGQQEDPSKDWPVVESRAKAFEIWGHGDDPNEWGYHPGQKR